MKKISDYTYKDKHGGIIVDKDGNTVAGMALSKYGLEYADQERFRIFQNMAALYVAKLIRGDKDD